MRILPRAALMVAAILVVCEITAFAQVGGGGGVSRSVRHTHKLADHVGAIKSDQDITVVLPGSTSTIRILLDASAGDIWASGTIYAASTVSTATGTFNAIVASNTYITQGGCYYFDFATNSVTMCFDGTDVDLSTDLTIAGDLGVGAVTATGLGDFASITTGGGAGSTGCSLNSDGDAFCDGSSHFTTYFGDGSNLTGISAGGATPTWAAVTAAGATTTLGVRAAFMGLGIDALPTIPLFIQNTTATSGIFINDAASGGVGAILQKRNVLMGNGQPLAQQSQLGLDDGGNQHDYSMQLASVGNNTDGDEDGVYSLFVSEAGSMTPYFQTDGANEQVSVLKDLVVGTGGSTRSAVINGTLAVGDTPFTTMTLFTRKAATDFSSPVGNAQLLTSLANGANTSQQVAGVGSSVFTDDNFDYTGVVVGLSGSVEHEGNGTVGDASSGAPAIGVIGTVDNVSTGTIDLAVGVFGDILNETTGTMTAVVALGAGVENAAGGGTITDAYTINAFEPENSGTITNMYGVMIEDHSGIGVTDSYNLYSSGAASVNYFQGNVRASGTYYGDGASLTGITLQGVTAPGSASTTSIIEVGGLVSNATASEPMYGGNHTGTGDLINLEDSGATKFQMKNDGEIELNYNAAQIALEITDTTGGNIFYAAFNESGPSRRYIFSDVGMGISKGSNTPTPTHMLEILSDRAADGLLIEVAENGVSGVLIEGHHNSASPATDDIMLGIEARGEDSASNEMAYGQILFKIGNFSSGFEDGKQEFTVLQDSVLTTYMTIDGEQEEVSFAKAVDMQSTLNVTGTITHTKTASMSLFLPVAGIGSPGSKPGEYATGTVSAFSWTTVASIGEVIYYHFHMPENHADTDFEIETKWIKVDGTAAEEARFDLEYDCWKAADVLRADSNSGTIDSADISLPTPIDTFFEHTFTMPAATLANDRDDCSFTITRTALSAGTNGDLALVHIDVHYQGEIIQQP